MLGDEHRAFLWENGAIQDLGMLGDPSLCPASLACPWTFAYGINNAAQVVGLSRNDSGERRASHGDD